MLNEYLSYDASVPLYLQSFNKFERSLIGVAADRAARRQIWNSIVFYNYLLADGTRIKTTPVKHPSTGYAWTKWHQLLNEFLR